MCRTLTASTPLNMVFVIRRDFVRNWDVLALQCVTDVRQAFEEVVYGTADKQFDGFDDLNRKVQCVDAF